MKLALSTLALATYALSLSAFAPARADSGCADTKATQVDVEITKSGDAHRCGIGIVVLGVGGGLFGPRCVEHETRTPAHQACMGEANKGTKCVPETTLGVETRDCHCGGLVIPGIEIGIPTTCVCSDWFASGTVEDMKTVLCNE